MTEYRNMPAIRILYWNENLTRPQLPPEVLLGNYSESYALNMALYSLSSIQRTAIRSSQWTNPSVITPSTIIIGFCCELPGSSNCDLQEFVLVLSMAIWNHSRHNIYFQKCLKNGLTPQHPKSQQVTIKQRRDPLLNNNNTKQWIVPKNKEDMWFQPDMYLCQGYFWDQSIIDTRTTAADKIHLDHQDTIDLLQDDIVFARQKNVPSHRLSTYRPLLVTTNTEFWGGGLCKRYDIIFDTVIGRGYPQCTAIHAPPAFWYEFMRRNNHTTQLILPSTDEGKQRYLQQILSIKNQEMFRTLFLVKFCYKEGRYNADALVRVLVFDKLKVKYLAMDGITPSIDALSYCRFDKSAKTKMGKDFIPRGMDQTFGYQGVRDGAVEMALKYKFMIAMENSRTKGYMTEKLLNAFYGYTIPIYFGDDMADTYFNEKRFINCNVSDEDAQKLSRLTGENKKNHVKNDEGMLLKQVDEMVGSRIDECVDRVIEIDQNMDKYKAMLLEPVFKDNIYDGSILDPFAIANKFKKTLKTIDSYLLYDYE
eukprot:619226_1